MRASVILPVHNAVHRLPFTLQSFHLQYTPFDQFELIVVDNASDDGTGEWARRCQTEYTLRVLTMPKGISRAEALNAGIAASAGDVVILVGGDAIVPRDFVGTHLQAHRTEAKLVMAGVHWRRVYSVYYPDFSLRQKLECEEWLEHYPYIKRPHTTTGIVPLLDEKLLAHGLLAEIALPARNERRAEAAVLFGPKLAGCDAPWRFFRSRHVSLRQAAFAQAGMFDKRLFCQSQADQELGKRLHRAGYAFHLADRLVLIDQEHPPVRKEGGKERKGKRR